MNEFRRTAGVSPPVRRTSPGPSSVRRGPSPPSSRTSSKIPSYTTSRGTTEVYQHYDDVPLCTIDLRKAPLMVGPDNAELLSSQPAKQMHGVQVIQTSPRRRPPSSSTQGRSETKPNRPFQAARSIVRKPALLTKGKNDHPSSSPLSRRQLSVVQNSSRTNSPTQPVGSSTSDARLTTASRASISTSPTHRSSSFDASREVSTAPTESMNVLPWQARNLYSTPFAPNFWTSQPGQSSQSAIGSLPLTGQFHAPYSTAFSYSDDDRSDLRGSVSSDSRPSPHPSSLQIPSHRTITNAGSVPISANVQQNRHGHVPRSSDSHSSPLRGSSQVDDTLDDIGEDVETSSQMSTESAGHLNIETEKDLEKVVRKYVNRGRCSFNARILDKGKISQDQGPVLYAPCKIRLNVLRMSVTKKQDKKFFNLLSRGSKVAEHVYSPALSVSESPTDDCMFTVRFDDSQVLTFCTSCEMERRIVCETLRTFNTLYCLANHPDPVAPDPSSRSRSGSSASQSSTTPERSIPTSAGHSPLRRQASAKYLQKRVTAVDEAVASMFDAIYTNGRDIDTLYREFLGVCADSVIRQVRGNLQAGSSHFQRVHVNGKAADVRVSRFAVNIKFLSDDVPNPRDIPFGYQVVDNLLEWTDISYGSSGKILLSVTVDGGETRPLELVMFDEHDARVLYWTLALSNAYQMRALEELNKGSKTNTRPRASSEAGSHVSFESNPETNRSPLVIVDTPSTAFRNNSSDSSGFASSETLVYVNRNAGPMIDASTQVGDAANVIESLTVSMLRDTVHSLAHQLEHVNIELLRSHDRNEHSDRSLETCEQALAEEKERRHQLEKEVQHGKQLHKDLENQLLAQKAIFDTVTLEKNAVTDEMAVLKRMLADCQARLKTVEQERDAERDARIQAHKYCRIMLERYRETVDDQLKQN